MSLEKNFCPSPWLHMRVHSDGSFGMCRWTRSEPSTANLIEHDVQDYFQNQLAPVRQQFLQGSIPSKCSGCVEQEQHGKVSGRLRQLLKIGVRPDAWPKTMLSSPWLSEFMSSNGRTDQMPVDWQIDLGNQCNSACVFCRPEFSSRLAAEQVKLKILPQYVAKRWSDDHQVLEKFADQISAIPNLKYLHFIGGEPLMIPAFRIMLQSLISNGTAPRVSLGFTTNLTVYDSSLAELLSQFQQINLGLSVECFHPVNDYVRYPSRIEHIQDNAEKWVELAKQQSWLVQMRVTPTWLTVHRLHTVFDWAWYHGVSVESCNFIQQPEFFRPSVLPRDVRDDVIARLKIWLANHASVESRDQVINTRNPDWAQTQLVQDLQSYVDFLTSAPDQSDLMPQAVSRLKQYEDLRHNSILDYLPEYESILRSCGY